MHGKPRRRSLPRNRIGIADPPARTPWRAARRLAGAQHGVLSRSQLLALGIGSGAIEHRLRTGELRPLHRGVYLLGPVEAPRAKEMAAALACGAGAYVSHASAAALHRLPPFPEQPATVHVSVVGREVDRAGIVAHRISALEADEVLRLDRIPLTGAARTILDLAPSLGFQNLEHLIAQAYAARKTSRTRLLALLERYPSRPGAPLLRELLEAPGGPAFTRSDPERRLLALIRRARLPEPQANRRLGRWEVDLLWADEGLVVEVDALSTHTSPRDFERDRRKDAELTVLGYLVVRVTRRQILTEPEAVIARIAGALVRAAARESRLLYPPAPHGF